MSKETQKVLKEHALAAKVEKYWSTLAKKEGKGNLRTAIRYKKEGKKILADFFMNEYLIDEKFAKLREDLYKYHMKFLSKKKVRK